MSICMCKIFHKRGKFSNAQLSFANFEIRVGAHRGRFRKRSGRNESRGRHYVASLSGHATFAATCPRRRKGKRTTGRMPRVPRMLQRRRPPPRPRRPTSCCCNSASPGQSLTTEDSECSLDDADPRRPPSPKHRTQHSKYELNDMRRRCEEL